MYRNLLVLPDGTEIMNGIDTEYAIQSFNYTASVNNGNELTPGSVFSAWIETKLFTPGGNLTLPTGQEITAYKVDEEENRTQVGLFTLRKPERPSRNTYKITAYDRVSWLDRDIVPFLKSLDGWPYSLLTLARMVCEDCLLTLVNDWIPNGNFPVNKFPASKMTARELMGYIGQLSGRFCRATPEGEIEFAWYEDSGVVLRSTGERYYNTLKYEDYQVERIDTVQVQMAEGEYGLLFPEGKETDNAYIISGNPLITVINESLKQYLEVIRWEIGASVYTPCRVTLPASLDIQPGHIVRIIDRDDRIIDTYVMTKTQKGQKDTLESTGSARRDSPSVVSAKTPQDYADAAMKRQTQTDIFNKLTNYGTVEGLFLEENGQIFVNAAYIATGILQSKDGSTFYLDLDNGILEMSASSLSISGESIGSAALKNMTQQELVDVLTRGGAADGIYLKDGQIYINAEYIQSGTLKADFITSGVLKSADGKAFYLDLDMGTFKMAGTGKFLSEDGKSYMTMDGGSFVLRTLGAEDKWGAIAKIGYTEDSDGVDYPYMIMGHALDSAQERNLTLVKTFSNGIYIGNAVPKLNTGKFLGLPGAVGFFVDIENKKTYNVVGDELYDAFTAVFG